MNWKKLICDTMPNDKVMERREPYSLPKGGREEKKEKKKCFHAHK